jgi:hypothetical protein
VVGVTVRRGWRSGAGIAAPFALLSLPWALWSGAAGRALPGPLRDILGPYGSWLAAQAGDSPARFVAALGAAAGGIARRTLELLVPAAPPAVWWTAAPALALALAVGTWLLGRRSPTAALALLLSLVMAWLWPFQDRRLLLPVLPLLLLALACVAHALLKQLPRRVPAALEGERSTAIDPTADSAPRALARPRLASALLAALAIWATGFAATSAVRLATGWVAAGYEIRARQLSSALAAIRGRLPPRAVLGAPELWPALHLINGVRVAPSARFRPLAPEGVPVWGTPEEQFELWTAAGITQLLLEQGAAIHGEALDALEAACPGAVGVLDVRPGQIFVRLGWDEACRVRVGAV